MGGEDRLSSLPDSLLCEILLKLSTKDVVRSSVLSTRLGNLWRFVPGLDLNSRDFSDYDAFLSFVDKFLGFNSESCIQYLKLKHDSDEDGSSIAHVTRWINTVVNRKVKHFDFMDKPLGNYEIEIPPTLYTCESLVSLELGGVVFPDPKFVSLPCVKSIYLGRVKFANDLAFEMLISGCPVLERLSIWMSSFDNDNVNCLRVCSKSLLRFYHSCSGSKFVNKDLVVAIDAPRLVYLSLSDHEASSFLVNNLGSLVKVNINILFKLRYGIQNNLPKMNMIRSFLNGISTVKDIVISSPTLEVIYDYLRCQPLPLFRNLSSMRATDHKWQMLPDFLECCPNLKSLVLESIRNREKEGIGFSPGRRRFLSSLEYVEMKRPLLGLVSYFLENSTLCLDDSRKEGESVILKRILTTPTLSPSCQLKNLQAIDSVLG